MERKCMELAGLPAGILVGLENRAHSNALERAAQLGPVVALLGAFSAVLGAEEILLNADLPALAAEARVFIEIIRARARAAIEAAVQAPGDAYDRITLLGHAVDLEGADGPLVARIAFTLAAANALPAVALAG